MAGKRKIENPFFISGYEGPDYFCDREKETKKIIESLNNGFNITLISPRRIGKTGLIKNVFYYLKEQEKDAICIYIDIFATKNIGDFISLFGNAVMDEIMRQKRSLYNKAKNLIAALRPTVSIDALTGSPTFSVTVQPQNYSITLKSTFDYLNSIDRKVFIAIDEFQQITEYPESGIEAELRSYIQFSSNVHFIFSGSKHHLMLDMFGSPKRPFYHSTELMSIEPLNEDVYYKFARNFFTTKGGDLSKDIFHQIYQSFDGITWYIQNILNRLYRITKNIKKKEQLNAVMNDLLEVWTPQYAMLSQFLTENQFRLLKAIAMEGKVEKPTAGDFIRKYSLPAASSVRAALTVLLDKEMVYEDTEGYIVYDRLMRLWLINA